MPKTSRRPLSRSPARRLPGERLISLRDLLDGFKDRGVNDDTITRLREGYFISLSCVKSLGDEAGTASFYPAETVPIVERYLELSEAARRGEVPRNKDDWLWRMRFEGLPVDIRGWAVACLVAASKAVEQAGPGVADTLAEGTEGKKFSRAMRVVRSRVHKAADRAEAIRWALSVARGENPEVSLYERDIEPSPLQIVLKISGLSVRLPPPHHALRVEEATSIAKLRETLLVATPADVERACRDLGKFDAGLISVPLAGLNRHARRSLGAKGSAITQHTITLFRAIWREYTARAIFLAKSIEWTGRQPPAASRRIDHDRRLAMT